MLDTNCPWTAAEAIEMARAFAPYRLAWLEEPVWPPEDYDGLARVRGGHADADRPGRERVDGLRLPRDRRARRRRHAAAEHHQGRRHLGVPEDRRARRGREPAHRAPLVLLGSRARRDAARRRDVRRLDLPVEFPTGEHETPFLVRPIGALDGVVVPPGPGLGVEINEDAIKRHRYGPETPFSF